MAGVGECNKSILKQNPLLKSVKFDSESRDIILLNKHSTVGLQINAETEDTVRKKIKNNKSTISIRTPPPPAVARRNARERNRVKQVNNGFANLRQHIPNSIAAAFESGRNGNKKLSKVETLRMAVEYIRSLEKILDFTDISSPSDSSTISYESSKVLERQSGNIYARSLTSPSSEDDTISTNSTPPPLQYVKLVDSDVYHVIPMQMFQSNEQLKSIKIENDLLSNSTSIDPELEYKKVQLSSDINTNAALSPEIYSDSSLSPVTQCDMPGFIPVFNVQELPTQSTSKVKENVKSPNEEMHILCRNLIMLQADADVTSGKQPLNINELMSW